MVKMHAYVYNFSEKDSMTGVLLSSLRNFQSSIFIDQLIIKAGGGTVRSLKTNLPLN